MAFVRLLFVFLLPPVAVYLQSGADRNLAINIVLTLLGFFPGMLHAIYLMAARPPGLIRRDRMNSPPGAQRPPTNTYG